VRVFHTFTPDLEALVAWLVACRIDTVAMESTGVYWVPIYELLEQQGIVPYLVIGAWLGLAPPAGLFPTGRFGGQSPPKSDLFVAAFCQRSWQKAATKELFSGACGPTAPAGELASSIMDWTAVTVTE
jgi:hypothetical protein